VLVPAKATGAAPVPVGSNVERIVALIRCIDHHRRAKCSPRRRSRCISRRRCRTPRRRSRSLRRTQVLLRQRRPTTTSLRVAGDRRRVPAGLRFRIQECSSESRNSSNAMLKHIAAVRRRRPRFFVVTRQNSQRRIDPVQTGAVRRHGTSSCVGKQGYSVPCRRLWRQTPSHAHAQDCGVRLGVQATQPELCRRPAAFNVRSPDPWGLQFRGPRGRTGLPNNTEGARRRSRTLP